jgi:hypothetical protein
MQSGFAIPANRKSPRVGAFLLISQQDGSFAAPATSVGAQ